MSSKKGQAQPAISPVSLKKAFRRFEDIKSEFSRIQWIEEGSALGYAKVVILATFMCGMLLYVADLFVQGLLTGVDGFLRMIFG